MDVGYEYDQLEHVQQRYDVNRLKDGWNTMPDVERIFSLRNLTFGLWAARSQFRVLDPRKGARRREWRTVRDHCPTVPVRQADARCSVPARCDRPGWGVRRH